MSNNDNLSNVSNQEIAEASKEIQNNFMTDEDYSMSQTCMDFSIDEKSDGFDAIGEVTVLTILADNSASMGYFRRAMIEAFEKCLLPPLRNSKEAKKIVIRLVLFNDRIQASGYVKIDDVPYNAYNPNGTTALYDTIVIGARDHLGYVDSLINRALTVRSIFLLMTDGEDMGSREANVQMAKSALEEMTKREMTVVMIGFGEDTEKEANALGLTKNKRQYYKIDDLTPEQLKDVFGVISNSVLRTSQGVQTADQDFFNGQDPNTLNGNATSDNTPTGSGNVFDASDYGF